MWIVKNFITSNFKSYLISWTSISSVRLFAIICSSFVVQSARKGALLCQLLIWEQAKGEGMLQIDWNYFSTTFFRILQISLQYIFIYCRWTCITEKLITNLSIFSFVFIWKFPMSNNCHARLTDLLIKTIFYSIFHFLYDKRWLQ
jgi:hypothetical protein